METNIFIYSIPLLNIKSSSVYNHGKWLLVTQMHDGWDDAFKYLGFKRQREKDAYRHN
jgi:hypothetical protein